MATKKYDWQAIKREYLSSSIDEVNQFLISFLSVDPKNASNGSYAKATKGWRDEKESIKATQTNKAIQRLENDESVKISNVKLLQAKAKLLNIITNGLNDLGELIEFDQSATPIINRNASGLKTFWEMIKVELGETTTIAKNTNENNDVSTSELAKALERLAKAKESQK